MESDFFTDNKNRVARKLLQADGVVLGKQPACYAVENKETENFYVGSTKNISQRVNAHLHMLKNNQHSNQKLQDEFNNCQDKNNFVVHVSFEESVEAAINREQLVLDEGHGTDVLLNISDNAKNPSSGYDRSHVVSKLNDLSKTSENRERVSQESISRWENPDLRKQMISSMGENVIVDGVKYGSVREASRETGVCISSIRARLNNGECSLTDVTPVKKSVVCEGKEYQSVNEAAEAYGVKPNTMTSRLKSNSKSWTEFNYK